ncbi:MAG: Crp/Fnr family transcriptional regulator [Nannocystales bacterium]
MSSELDSLIRLVAGEHVQLSGSDVRALAATMTPMRRAPDELLFARADAPSAFVLFDRGLARTYTIDARGRERNLRFLAGPNLATALSSVIRGTATEEWVAAVTSIEGYRGNFGALRPHPRFEALMRALAEQHFLSLERRVRTLQQPFAKARYRVFRQEMEPTIVDAMPEHHIASYLGVTPETLSRAKRNRRPD